MDKHNSFSDVYSFTVFNLEPVREKSGRKVVQCSLCGSHHHNRRTHYKVGSHGTPGTEEQDNSED